MNIYISHAGSFNFESELYQPIRNSRLNSQYNFILPHEHSSLPFLIKEKLREIDLVIAEVSYPSTGQGIELGWASMSKIPVVCLYKKGIKYSSSLQTITGKFKEYNDSKDLINKITEILKNLNDAGSNPGS